jgi:hypothetical protein
MKAAITLDLILISSSFDCERLRFCEIAASLYHSYIQCTYYPEPREGMLPFSLLFEVIVGAVDNFFHDTDVRLRHCADLRGKNGSFLVNGIPCVTSGNEEFSG